MGDIRAGWNRLPSFYCWISSFYDLSFVAHVTSHSSYCTFFNILQVILWLVCFNTKSIFSQNNACEKNIFINFHPLIVDYLFVTSKTKMAALIKIMRTMDDWQPHSAITPAPIPQHTRDLFCLFVTFPFGSAQKKSENLQVYIHSNTLHIYIFNIHRF